MKVRNHIIYSSDPEELRRLAGEYRFLGREVELHADRIVVLALPSNARQKQNRRRNRRRRRSR